LAALSVILLAGGSSTRIGRNKLWLLLDGQPLIERVVRRVCPLTSDIVLSTSNSQQFVELQRSLPGGAHGC
jgi:molybdenum cofactor guanylyltransferase